jgi:hypothetical protein
MRFIAHSNFMLGDYLIHLVFFRAVTERLTSFQRCNQPTQDEKTFLDFDAKRVRCVTHWQMIVDLQ